MALASRCSTAAIPCAIVAGDCSTVTRQCLSTASRRSGVACRDQRVAGESLAVAGRALATGVPRSRSGWSCGFTGRPRSIGRRRLSRSDRPVFVVERSMWSREASLSGAHGPVLRGEAWVSGSER
jgi:hypothetical protein